ncbi:DUF5959 family protein [Streptomyces sp. NPDC060064]|uniref:DUF5959 family protein n=1 Tax=Streptomyces sp. NPDC060064 TaxID=3347049 RepID=UPI00369D56DE
MASEGPIDLISLEGEGTSVIVRITGKKSAQDPPRTDALVGEIIVDTAFVRGSIATWIFPEDLTEWQGVLDALDGGADVAWLEGKRTTEMLIELDPDGERAHVTIADRSMSLTTVTVTVVLTDAWFDDAYRRLDQVLQTWPSEDA